jgi:hypothetical protein
MNTLPMESQQQLTRWQWGSLTVGAVALVICAAGGLFLPLAFFRAYLIAYLFFLGLAHGGFVVLMIYHLTGGAWGFLVRRILEAGMRTLPLMLLLFVPIALGAGVLYPWAQPELAKASPSIEQKQVYLNLPFFWLRAALYFVCWLVVAHFLSAWSRKQDRAEDEEDARLLAEKLARLSGPGLAMFGITLTFAVVDWLMSLQPAFRSTIFGPLFASGEMVTGFGATLILLAWLTTRPPLADFASVDALNDLGSLLFTFLIIWAYMTWFEFMLIWIADLPYDVLWYLPRLVDGWQWVALVLVILHFFVPFFLLLMRGIKRNPRTLAGVAGLILIMHLIYMYYQVVPAFERAGLDEHWLDFVAPVGVGGIWLACFLWNLNRYPVLPRHDVNREAAVHFRELDRHEPEVHHA